jgi:hypothetical protein
MIVVAVPWLIAVGGVGRPDVAVGGDEPRLSLEGLAWRIGQAVKESSLELASVGHQPKEIDGNYEATDVDQDEDIQLSARPFH